MKSYFNEETGKWNHRFRQSLLNTASICAERARLTLLEEMPYDHTDSAGMGTAVHAGIEAELSGKVGSYEQGLEVIEEAWWEEQRQPDFKWVKHSGNTAWKTIQVYWGHWYNQYDPHSRHQRGWELEHPFLYTVHEDEHRLIEMSGTYDAYDGFKLTDWKTSGRGPYDVQEKKRWAIQPTVYSQAVFLETGNNPPFEFVVMHADGLQRLTVMRDERDWAWLAETCVGYATMIEAELPAWPKVDQSWLCSRKYCSAWDRCKGKHYSEENTQ